MPSGGKRPGAGRPVGSVRPKKESTKVYLGVRLSPEIAIWLDGYKNKSAMVEKALAYVMRRVKQKKVHHD